MQALKLRFIRSSIFTRRKFSPIGFGLNGNSARRKKNGIVFYGVSIYMKKKHSTKKLWSIAKKAGNGFIDDKLMKISGALSFYMAFSMGPLLLIIITICSIFFGREAVEGKVYAQLESFVGRDTAIQLQQIIIHAAVSGKNTLATIIGVAFLMIGASSVFAEMQDSINMILGTKTSNPGQVIVAFLKNRLLSFSIIIGLGFLLLVSLSFSALVEAFGTRLQNAFPSISVTVLYILNNCITITITIFSICRHF